MNSAIRLPSFVLASILLCWGCGHSSKKPAREERLREATAFQQKGEQLLQGGSFLEAQRYFVNAYQTRQDLLGSLDTNTLASRRYVAITHFLNAKDPKERLKWGFEMQAASTNLLEGGAPMPEMELSRVLATSSREEEMKRGLFLALEKQAGRSNDTPGWKEFLNQKPVTSNPVQKAAFENARQQGQKMDQDLFNNATVKAAMEFSRGADQALTKNPANGLQSQNEMREYIEQFRRKNPEAAKLLGAGTDHDSPSRVDANVWFEREWKRWNMMFEDGVPLEYTVMMKGLTGPLQAIPAEFEQNPEIMAKLALGLKGLLLDRELREQAALRTSTEPWVEEFRAKLLAAYSEAGQIKPSTKESMLAAERLFKLKKELKRQLAMRPGYERLPLVSVAEVKTHLPTSSVLVEFLRYGRDYGGLRPIEARYGAVVIAKDKPPAWIPLDPAEKTETLIKRYQQLMRMDETSVQADLQTRNNEVKQVLDSLYDAVWRPLEPALTGSTSVVFVAADSALHLISFNTLLNQGRFLCQDYFLSGLAGGRDLLRKHPSSVNRRMEIWANPAFEALPKLPPTANHGIGSALDWLFSKKSAEGGFFAEALQALPGTAEEAKILKNLGVTQRMDVDVHSGEAASELELKKTRNPYILHLATHGIFVSNHLVGERSGLGESLTPRSASGNKYSMERSGMAFSGANPTIAGWVRGERIPTEGDGVLTAFEAASLALDKTWLVVMSGCDTGVGDAVDGEDVLGMKRAFIQAGAWNVLFSVWRVNDDYAIHFMEKFYRAALENGDARHALARLQARELAQGEDSLWLRVKHAGPFAMNSIGTGD